VDHRSVFASQSLIATFESDRLVLQNIAFTSHNLFLCPIKLKRLSLSSPSHTSDSPKFKIQVEISLNSNGTHQVPRIQRHGLSKPPTNEYPGRCEQPCPEFACADRTRRSATSVHLLASVDQSRETGEHSRPIRTLESPANPPDRRHGPMGLLSRAQQQCGLTLCRSIAFLTEKTSIEPEHSKSQDSCAGQTRPIAELESRKWSGRTSRSSE
jgi:hypothetical protein